MQCPYVDHRINPHCLLNDVVCCSFWIAACAVFWCQSLLRQEVNILGILHDTDCANSFPCVLGIFQHPGSLRGLIPASEEIGRGFGGRG